MPHAAEATTGDSLTHGIPPEFVLKHVVIMTRHGDRCPVSAKLGSYTLDEASWHGTLPDKADLKHRTRRYPTHGPRQLLDEAATTFGQLTAVGANQQHALGSALRARLAHYAPQLLDGPLTARSTNMRRTVQSAQCTTCTLTTCTLTTYY